MSKDVEAVKIKEGDAEFDFLLKKESPIPQIAIEEIPEDKRQPIYTAEDLKRISEETVAKANAYTDSVAFKAGKTQVMSKKKAPIIDFSTLTPDDIYNMDIPIEARPFMAGDQLKVKLKDSNYEARWVSTQSQRLGYMKSVGFSYVVVEDLEANLESEVSKDAQDHFTINDVVLMKIQKAKYYPALRAAHNRSVDAMKSVKASQNGMAAANAFMTREARGEFVDATNSGQMSFYNPGA